MYYKVKKCEPIQSKRNDGRSDIRITMVWLYNNEGNFVKRVKLDEFIKLLPEYIIAHPANFYTLLDIDEN